MNNTSSRPRAYLDTDPLLYEHRAVPVFTSQVETDPRLRNEFRRRYEATYGAPWELRALSATVEGGAPAADIPLPARKGQPAMAGVGGKVARSGGMAMNRGSSGTSYMGGTAAGGPGPTGGPMPLRTRQTRMKIVAIDSRDRDIVRYPNASSFRIELPEEVPNVRRVRLASLEFPHNEQLIRSQPVSKRNNKLYWINNTLEEQNTIYSITIDDGNYTSASFAAELLRKLNQVERLTADAGSERKYHRYTITMDAVRSILTLRNSERVTLNRPFTCFAGSNYIESRHERHNFKKGQLVFVENSQSFGGIPVDVINSKKYIDLVIETIDRFEQVNSFFDVVVGTTRRRFAGLVVGTQGQRRIRILGNNGDDISLYHRIRLGYNRTYTVTRIDPTGYLELAEPIEEDLPDDFLIENYQGHLSDAIQYIGKDPETGEDLVRLLTITHKLRAIESTPGYTPRVVHGLAEVTGTGDVVARLTDERQERQTNDMNLGIYSVIQRELTFRFSFAPNDVFRMTYVSKSPFPDSSFFTVRGNILDWVVLNPDTSGLGKTFVGLQYPDGTDLPVAVRPANLSGPGPFRLQAIRISALQGWRILFDGRDQSLWACPPWNWDQTVPITEGSVTIQTRTPKPWLFGPTPATPTWWTDMGFYQEEENDVPYFPGFAGYNPTILGTVQRFEGDRFRIRTGISRARFLQLRWVGANWTVTSMYNISLSFSVMEEVSVAQVVSMIQTRLELAAETSRIAIRHDSNLLRVLCQDTLGGVTGYTWAVMWESPADSGDGAVTLASALGFDDVLEDGSTPLWTFQCTHARHPPSLSKTATVRLQDFSEYALGSPMFLSKERGLGRVHHEEGNLLTLRSLPAVWWCSDIRAFGSTVPGGSTMESTFDSESYRFQIIPQEELAAQTGLLPEVVPPYSVVGLTRNYQEVRNMYTHNGYRAQFFQISSTGWTERGSTATIRWPLLFTQRTVVLEDGILELQPATDPTRPPTCVQQSRHQVAISTMEPPYRDLVYLEGGIRQVLPLDRDSTGAFWIIRKRAERLVTTYDTRNIPGLIEVSDILRSNQAYPGIGGEPKYLVVRAKITENGIEFQGPTTQADPELLAMRSSQTLVLPLGCVIDVLFEESITEAFLYSTVPDGEHSYGRTLDFFTTKQSFQRVPILPNTQKYGAIQRIDLRFENMSGFPALPASMTLRRLGVVGEVFPYFPSYPGGAGTSRIWFCLPPLTDATWVQVVQDPEPEPFFPVRAGCIVDRLPSGRWIAPLHRVTEPSGVSAYLGTAGAPTSLVTLSPFLLNLLDTPPPDESRFMYLEIDTLLAGRVYYPIRWETLLVDVMVKLQEAFQDYLQRGGLTEATPNIQVEATPLVNLLAPIERPATFQVGYVRQPDRPLTGWNTLRERLQINADEDSVGAIRFWFQTPPGLDHETLFHSAASLWGWPSGSVVTLTPQFQQRLEDQILWEVISPNVPNQEITAQHLLLDPAGVLGTSLASTLFWHMPLDYSQGPSGWILSGPFRGIPGSEFAVRWTSSQLMAVGPDANRLYRIVSLGTSEDRAFDTLTLRRESLGAILTQEPFAHVIGEKYPLYEFVESDFIFTRWTTGDYVQAFQSETLEAPADNRYFSASDQSAWSIVEVVSLFRLRLSPMTSLLWQQDPEIVLAWNKPRFHKAYYLKNNMRYYLQLTIAATESRTERGGNAVDIGSGVPYSLLFDRDDTPADILGFPKARTPFRTVHTNTTVDNTYQVTIFNTQPGTGTKRFLTRVETLGLHGLVQGEMVYISGHRGSSNDEGINSDEGHLVVTDESDPRNVFYIPIQIERGGIGGDVQKRRLYRPYNLTGDNYVFITSPQLVSGVSTSSHVRNVLAKVLLNSPPGAVIFNSYVAADKVFEEGALSVLRSLDLSVIDPEGEFYDFLNVDWSMTLEIEYEVDVIQGSYVSSRTGFAG